jgi:restriction system protein
MIPDFQSIMLPLLKRTNDLQEHSLWEAREYLSNYFKLTDEEKEEMLPSWTQARFTNRVAWAKWYLNQAWLLELTKRWYFKITKEWINVLWENIDRITINYLLKFDKFKTFRNKKNEKEEVEESKINYESEETPEEYIESWYKKLNDILSSELLTKIKEWSPGFFESLVLDLLLAMWYWWNKREMAEVKWKSWDWWIDWTIKEDKLWLDIIYVQAKKREAQVPIKEIRDFTWALLANKANKWIFITTSSFPKSAYDFVNQVERKIILIDWDRLVNLMIEHNVGVSVKNTYLLKSIDYDYFDE